MKFFPIEAEILSEEKCYKQIMAEEDKINVTIKNFGPRDNKAQQMAEEAVQPSIHFELFRFPAFPCLWC